MSLTSNSNKGTSEILQLSLNDSALDLLNAAIASHQVKNENTSPTVNSGNESPDTTTEKSSDLLHSKRELEKDAQTPTAPKRAGRKPLDKSQIPDASLDPKQKRKAQNRAAQRAFRDRKEKYVSELQARIEELEKLNATKDEDLIKENTRLKEMLQKLQEENYALKGAKFTFEFPLNNNSIQPPTTHDLTNLPSDMNNFFSSGNSYSEDASSSAEQSPLSKSHTHEDDSTSSDTPITNNTMFSADPVQFGLINPPNLSTDLDFLAVTDNTGLSDSLTKNDTLPTADLFHGKDDLFSNYLPPNTTDDFLFTNGADLTNLFGATDDLFGFNNTNMNAQFGLPDTPRRALPKEKKQQIVEKLKQAQQEGKHLYEGYQDLQKSCPDFDLDLLCDELKKKAQCSVFGGYPLTENDVDAFMKCMENK